MSKLFLTQLLVVCVMLSANICLAAYDTSQNDKLLCAFTEVIECNALGECLEVLPENVGLPDFVLIDLTNKQLQELKSEGVRTSQIDVISNVDGKTILGGLENNHGWSAILSDENSFLSATISDELAGFVLFGTCLPKP